jgi:DNA invertase Pin-like site-specific DNA recombinase
MRVPVAIFTRVSTKSQDYSRQISDLTKLAEKHNFEIVATLTAKESGSKKKNEDRQAIQELLYLAKNRDIQKVLTTEVSRLGRNPLENVKLLEELHAYGVSILSQDMGVETLTPEGKASIVGEILYTVFSSIYKQETTKLSERIHSGLAEARKRGKTLGRPKGSSKTETDYLKEYAGVARDLKKGIPVVKVAKIHSITPKTVRKVKKAM